MGGLILKDRMSAVVVAAQKVAKNGALSCVDERNMNRRYAALAGVMALILWPRGFRRAGRLQRASLAVAAPRPGA